MASEREILQASIEGLHAELEASRAAHQLILEVSARQGEELHRVGRALQEAISAVGGAEAEVRYERDNRRRLSTAAGEFVRTATGLELTDEESAEGVRLILIPEGAFRSHVTEAFASGTEELRSFAYMNGPKDPEGPANSRTGEPMRAALARALKASSDPGAPALLEELASLAADPVFYKW